MVMQHSIQHKIKSDLGEFGCARGPQGQSSDFFVFHVHVSCRVTDPVCGFAKDDHAIDLATRPWGEWSSQIWVRARADFFVFFYFIRMVCSKKAYHAEENKKWPPTNRVRALAPTNRSSAAPLTGSQGGFFLFCMVR